MKLNKMREDMSAAFLAALKEDKIPWEQDWISIGRPCNAVTQKAYNGINSFWLSFIQEENGYSDPRWCTFKQAKENGWQVKKGEKGTHIEFWSLYDKEAKRKITRDEGERLKEELGESFYDRVKPVSSTYTVFNAEQIQGIPERVQEKPALELDATSLIEKRDVLLGNIKVQFSEGGDRAFYSPGPDRITMPEISQFKNEYGYMSTLLHEAGHATGHDSRLGRNLKGFFGSEDYAREELRAEIASAFTAQELGIGQMDPVHMENHKAYIQSWIKVLQENPEELFSAIKEAEKISDYLIEKGEFDQESVQEQEKTIDPSEQDLSQREHPVKENERYQKFVQEHEQMLSEISAKKIPVVINAFGGPGSGKTTSCMDICAQLKKAGYKAEYVQEYAKELVYEKNFSLLDGSEEHQFEMLKEQLHRMDRLVGETDFIVTDSPVLLNAIYNQELTPEYDTMVSQLHSHFHNFSFFMKRDEKEFQQEGRIHDLEQSKQKDQEIKDILKRNDIYYGTYSHETIGTIVKNSITNYQKINQIDKTADQNKDKVSQKNIRPRKTFYNKEESEKMTEYLRNNVSIVDVCRSFGYTPVRVGQTYYTLKEHDSVRLDVGKNCFFWNSTGDRGSVIDACVAFENMSKAEAYQHLYDMCGGQEAVYENIYGSNPQSVSAQRKPDIEKGKSVEKPADKKVDLPPKGESQRNVYAYLGKTRQISQDVIKDFIDRDMLYQDDHNNCVFVARDKEGSPVFGCKRGTNTYKKFVADCKGNDYSQGFYVDNGADKLFVSESVIDAMSKMTMLQEQGIDFHSYNYLALAGTQKQDPISITLDRHPEIKEVSLGLDNDNGGREAFGQIKTMLEKRDILLKKDMPLQEGQDWNGALCDYFKSKSEGKEIKVCEEGVIKKEDVPFPDAPDGADKNLHEHDSDGMWDRVKDQNQDLMNNIFGQAHKDELSRDIFPKDPQTSLNNFTPHKAAFRPRVSGLEL